MPRENRPLETKSMPAAVLNSSAERFCVLPTLMVPTLSVPGFALASAMIKIVADRGTAVMREFAGRLAVPLVPARRVMQEHHARERARA